MRAVALSSLLCVIPLPAQETAPRQAPPEQAPPELGTVAWQRDLDAALATAKSTQRPVFLLFQEIPGCATCRGFGRDVLAHPLLREVIEDDFVPVAVRNNVDGSERAVRERFAEPAWNNPVVRLLDGEGEDLLPRKDEVFDVHGIATRMVAALQQAKRPVPEALALVVAETAPDAAEATFAMHCFWQGEAELAALDGVLTTRAAFRDGAEVVSVRYDPRRITRQQLEAHAQQGSCRPVGGDHVTPAPAADQQHALGGTPYAKLELSPMQRCKVHAALTLGEHAERWLSPRQRLRLAELRRPPAAAGSAEADDAGGQQERDQ